MINLARHPGGTNQVRALAEQENIPRRFLEVIMADLRRAGLVDSTRGKAGGYRLARPSNLISFADIIRVIDGPLAMLPCASRNFYERCDDCDDVATCMLRKTLTQARDRMAEVLEGTTLANAVALPGPAGVGASTGI